MEHGTHMHLEASYNVISHVIGYGVPKEIFGWQLSISLV